MSKLNPIENRILVGAAADLAEWLATERPAGYGDAEIKAACDLAAEGIVKNRPGSWLGFDLDGSARMAVSRAYARLERLGLVERQQLGFAGTCTHLKLTEAGIARATERNTEAADAPARHDQ